MACVGHVSRHACFEPDGLPVETLFRHNRLSGEELLMLINIQGTNSLPKIERRECPATTCVADCQ